MKDCKAGTATPGLVSHQTVSQSFDISGSLADLVFDLVQLPGNGTRSSLFQRLSRTSGGVPSRRQADSVASQTLIAFTTRNEVWQSSNEGYSWHVVVPDLHVVAMTMHAYSRDRAYLVTKGRTVHYTTDKGNSWNTFNAPSDPNSLGIPLLDFHPLRPDWLIWTGMVDCDEVDSRNCRAVASYTKDNGRNWYKVEEYVRVCSWGRDKSLKLDEMIIFCESYRDKKGSQRAVYADNNPMQLVSGELFYTNKKVLFPSIVGFATFEQYMVVAEVRFPSSLLSVILISLSAASRIVSRYRIEGLARRKEFRSRSFPSEHASGESSQSHR